MQNFYMLAAAAYASKASSKANSSEALRLIDLALDCIQLAAYDRKSSCRVSSR